VIKTERDADVEIAKAAVTKSALKSNTLLLLFYYDEATNCTELYFRSVKVKSNVYNIKVRKKKLGEAVCNDLLFIHTFTGCDSTSRVFGIGKRSRFQIIIKAKFRCCGNQ